MSKRGLVSSVIESLRSGLEGDCHDPSGMEKLVEFASLDDRFLSLGRDDYLTLRDGLSHLLVLGSTGSGKSTTVLSHALMDAFRVCGGGCICTVNPDEADRVTRLAKQVGRADDIIHLHPGSDINFNPMEFSAGASPDASQAFRLQELLTNALRLYGTGAKNQGSNADPFWIQKQTEFVNEFTTFDLLANRSVSIKRVLQYLRHAPKSLDEVHSPEFRESSPVEAGLKSAFEHVEASNDPVAQTLLSEVATFILQEFPALDPKTRESVNAGIFGTLKSLRHPKIAACFENPTDIHKEDILDDRAILLFDYPPTVLGEAGRLYQGVCLTAMYQVINARQVDDQSTSLFIYIDEFQKFLTQQLAEDLAYQRSKRTMLIAGTQSVSAIVNALGGGPAAHDTANTILANFTNKFVLNCDNETAKYISAQIGDTKQFLGNSGGAGSSSSRHTYAGATETYLPQVPVQELMNLRRAGPPHFYAEVIAIRNGKPFSNGKNYLPMRVDQIKD